MPDKLAVFQAVFFIALLCAASVTDLTKCIVPNWLCLGIAGVSIIGFTPVKLLGILIALPFLLAAVFFGGMGGGDIKLMAACGLVLGLSKGLLAAMSGLSLLLLYAALYRIVCRVQRREVKKAFPLAPFLSAGCLLAYFIL
ncbi:MULTISPECIES: A24 family peptidase [Bacillota]|jgi:leader peptidase (prepilin peptidase)/N-methyltransferase|uniref:A24 family peptidase n=1 Tax=Bacillota TaxID=1239 RepID=UPI0028AA8A8A|nr:A24 family peptidase [Oscillibacter sp.]